MTFGNEKERRPRPYLALPYPAGWFYLERAPARAGLRAPSITPFPDGSPDLPGWMDLDGRPLALLDLEARLERIFGFTEERAVRMALIVETAALSEVARVAWTEWAGRRRPAVSSRRIGVRVCARVQLVSLPPSCFRPLPGGLRERLGREGFAGCRFTEDGGIGYLLDLGPMLLRHVTEPGVG